jgi:excisionase family DNA binding protein
MIDDPLLQVPREPMPITVRVREACRLTGIGRSKLYELIAVGEIRIIKVGTITLIPVASLTKLLQREANRTTASLGVEEG